MPKTTLAQAQTDLRRRNKIRSTLGSWAMVFPAILFLCVFTLYPMFNLVQISMYTVSYTHLDVYKRQAPGRV